MAERFMPKRVIRSFRDLEIYQRTLKASVEVVKNVARRLAMASLSGMRWSDAVLQYPGR